MAYISSGLIEAVDLNGFNALINEIRGDSYSGATGSTANRGYGQLNVTTNVSTGQVARAVDWNGLLTSISQVSQHQGTGVSVPSSVTAGNIMQVINALSSSIGTLLTNRFNIAPINATTTTNGTRLSSSRTSSWDNQIFHTYNITFTSWNAMRYFFNTGGRIISSPSFSGGSTAADTRWNSLANSVGNVVLDHTAFYNLTTSFSTIYIANNGSEEIRYRARLNGAAGSTNSIQIELRASSPNDGVQVTGTLTNRVDERRSTGVFLIPAPSYSTIIDLNSGGEVDPPISAVSISGGGTKSCSYTGSGCAVTFNLSANVTGGTGNFGYNWTLSDTTNYSITAGQGTANLTIVSSSGSTDLPTATVSVVVSDLTMVPVTGSANTTITAEKEPGWPPISNVSISGGGTKSCSYTTGGCTVTFDLSASVTGGSGNFGYNWTLSDTTNYSITAGQGTPNLTIVSSGGSTDLPTATVSVVVSDLSMVPITGSANTTITADKSSGYPPISNVSISGGGPKSCNYTTGGCSVTFNLVASVTGGSGNFGYNWTLSDTTNYSITAGQGTSNLTIVSSGGSTNLPTATVSVVVSDLTVVPETGSANTTINVEKSSGYSPFTGTTINTGGSTKSCTWNFDGPITCTNSWLLTTSNSGGSGSFTYSWSVSPTWASPGTAATYTVTSPPSATNQSATVSVTVTDTILGTSRTATAVINSNHVPGPISVTISGDTGTQSCSYTSGGCAVVFDLAASVTGGSGNFGYAWSVTDTSNYSITAGQGTSNVEIVSISGTTNLPSTNVSVTVTDNVSSDTDSASTSIKANKINEFAPFTAVTINTGGDNKTCIWDYDGINNGSTCRNTWALTATPTGGSGNFTYLWNVSPAWAATGYSATYNVMSPYSTTASQSATVSLTMTDATLGTSRSATAVINSFHKPGPITAIYPVTNTPPGSCSYTTGNCTTSAVYSVGTTPVAGVSGVIGGSGSFTGSVTKNSGATAITGSVTGGYGTPIVATISSTNTAGTYPFNYTLTVIDNDPTATPPTGNTAVLSGTFTHTVNPWDGSLAAATTVSSLCQFPVEGQNHYASSEILFYSDGRISSRTHQCNFGSENIMGYWNGAVANNSNSEIRFELISSNVPTGTIDGVNFDTWYSLDITYPISKSLTVSYIGAGQEQIDIRIHLRQVGNPGSVVTTSLELIAALYGYSGGIT